jgi:membrane-associated phospholipid phosphatase
MRIRVNPTIADVKLARAIARNTRPAPEEISQVVTWGADEHILTGLAVAWWLACRGQQRKLRQASDHVLLSTVAASVLPHLLKSIFTEIRPDRRTIRGHLHGIPLSGNAFDAFPSGHAIHIGALASAASELPPRSRNAAWLLGGALVTTRIVLLAHWASDVLTGLAIGALLERGIRLLTGFGHARAKNLPEALHGTAARTARA